jgi:DNA repair photolyase
MMAELSNVLQEQRCVHKGRGALSNRGSRYQPTSVEWDDGITGASPLTECRPARVRSIIARNSSPDIPFDQSINPYQGCEHGCIYCYARPTHAYLDLSPGVDFETRLTYKSNAAEQLARELSRPGYCCSSITLGANTDPYQPVEKKYQITRQVLEVLHQYRHPVTIITKGALVTRDLDLLADMAADGLCSVAISITSLDTELKRIMEPRAASPRARLAAMETLSNAGVPVSVLFAPVIPALNDVHMESILEEASSAGARAAAYILLRLPLEIRDLFFEWLQQHFPLRARHVISVLRQSRGGEDYDTRFGHRMRGTGPFADLLEQRFRVACRRLGLATGEAAPVRTDLFTPPTPQGGDLRAAANHRQFDLFTEPRLEAGQIAQAGTRS